MRYVAEPRPSAPASDGLRPRYSEAPTDRKLSGPRRQRDRNHPPKTRKAPLLIASGDVSHALKSRISMRMDVRLAHAVLIAFHRFQRASKSSRARFRIVSLIVLGSSL